MKQKQSNHKTQYMKFVFLTIIIISIVTIAAGCRGGEKIIWDDMVLGKMLSEPSNNKGEIHENSPEGLWVDINDISAKEYTDYIDSCKSKGFDVDLESSSISYEAYNKDGYKLQLSYYSSMEEMSIQLDPPIEMDAITWPSGIAGSKLPVPKSNTGNFAFEQDDNFCVYIGNTTKADYLEYVNACSERGFNVDYNKGDDYYYADNNEGWNVSIRYEGYNIMWIRIDPPEATSKPEVLQTASPAPTKKPETASTEKPSGSNSMNPDFKTAMDNYETFINEYVDFMKKYNANPSDLSLLAEYADYMGKYTNFVKDFEKWEDEDMNATELEYYIEVQSRINKKLLEVAY